MKTQTANKLGFDKSTLVELNDSQLQEVNGGSLLISIAVAAGGALVGAGIAYLLS
ncbi:class IIb bacteriocin, lactobin A/cerein 7B family [Flavobacterium cerinum]|uniref:Class IIb bacteriocin, lactobin A/cerein 7B family n=1 Tax=Flavobacterium cerinum TaxID=2502784 RepID=A0ABY5IV66_9FLAO|nr:class IIb bacteriocin, lactobin A/cerein 7B family [Flavobacterium cerinum]UUC46190.1 class IIb bacteriocin, lactobin A/cerein 7B family [Flavobacterium cerinum]UUC46191.1 class IIb bacteriocin, lactobin A/cerein 7B family [Flavobacterium cerinum]